MRLVVDRDGRALRRIVALLFALAQLAERAGSMPFLIRAIVLAVLRRAEAVAWAFAADIVWVGPECQTDDLRSQVPNAVDSWGAGHDGPADATRLALSLRALALILAHWAMEALSSPPMPPSMHRAVVSDRARPGANWRGPGALPAPDTS